MIIYYKSFYNFHENLPLNRDSNTKYKKDIKKMSQKRFKKVYKFR